MGKVINVPHQWSREYGGIDVDAHVVTDRATREKLVKAASECFMKAFKSVLRMRSVEEDLDRAANSLLELGVQPFHLIRQGCTASEPEPKFNR